MMEIREKFKAPFGPIPALRLVTIPRWPIIKMDTEQSVAEHVFGVVHIAEWLYNNTDYEVTDRKPWAYLMYEAFHHDDDEVYTSDIPRPAKESKDRHTGNDIVKLADTIEAYNFAKIHCVDTEDVKVWLLGELKQSMYNQIKKMGISYTKISPLMGN